MPVWHELFFAFEKSIFFLIEAPVGATSPPGRMPLWAGGSGPDKISWKEDMLIATRTLLLHDG
jgi:hypothetical protein